jgi:hypothetical protein
VAETSSIFVTVGGDTVVIENFAGGIPADVVKGNTPVIDNSNGNPAPSIKTTGDGGGWFYFTDPKWTATDFDISFDVYANLPDREIINLAFWVTSPGATADGYMLRVQTNATDGGFYSFAGGNHNSISTGMTPLTASTWYRVNIVGNATTSAVRAVVTQISNSSVLYDNTVVLSLPGNRSGTFGHKHDGLGGAGMHLIDNVTLVKGSAGGNDTAAITVSDASSLSGANTPVSASDTAAISIGDVSNTIAATNTTTDTAAISIAETSAVAKFTTSTDTTAVSVVETSAVAVTVTTTDTTAITIAETTANSNTLAASEAVAISIADASNVNAGGNPVGNDNASITITDSVGLLAKTGMQTADQGAISVADTSAVFKTLSATDTAAISVSEVSNPSTSLPGQDSAAISISEARTLAVTVNTTDTAAISIADVSSSFRTIAATDTTAISVADTSVVSLSLTATDTAAISVSDAAVKAIVADPTAMGEVLTVTDQPSPVLTATHQTITFNVTQAASSTITVTEVYV